MHNLATLIGYAFARCPTRLIYQHPHIGTWFENLAVREDGQLLLTSIGDPGNLFALDPFKPSPPVLIATFPGVNSTLGIVETTPENFFIVGSNFSLTPPTIRPELGTNAIFNVDLSGHRHDTKPLAARQIANLDRAHFLNGLTKFNDTLLLAADSGVGSIWAIDTHTNGYFLTSQDPLMAPSPETHGEHAEGINGLQFWNGEAYFTNTQRRLFGKVTLRDDAHASAPAQLIADSLTQDGVEVEWDDFALDGLGNAFVSTEQGQSVQMVSGEGMVRVVAGSVNSTALAEPTAAQFGRTTRDKHVLYVATAGGLVYPVFQDGTAVTLDAQVVAVDTSRCTF